MNTPIGKIESITGKFFAKDLSGKVIELKVGDTITENMVVFGDKNMTQDEKRRREMVNSYSFEKWLREERGFGGPSAMTYCNEHFGKEGDSYFCQFKHETLYGDYGKKGKK